MIRWGLFLLVNCTVLWRWAIALKCVSHRRGAPRSSAPRAATRLLATRRLVCLSVCLSVCLYVSPNGYCTVPAAIEERKQRQYLRLSSARVEEIIRDKSLKPEYWTMRTDVRTHTRRIKANQHTHRRPKERCTSSIQGGVGWYST
jgi:hypothetical protein